MEEEIWKDIPDYEGLYRASSYGRVESIKSNKILSTKVTSGYSRLTLYKNKVKKGFLTHRLIMATFYGKSDLQVDHINRIKTDNFISNLRYIEPRENIKHHFDSFETDVTSIGVRLTSIGKYSSRIWIDGHRYDLGSFFDEVSAKECYNNALLKYKFKGELPKEREYQSNYKGVSKVRDKFSAKITINKKVYHLGVYDLEEEASVNYQKASEDWKKYNIVPNYINQNKASKYEGIYFVKGTTYAPWKASVKIDNIRKYIGYFYTEEEAHMAQIEYINNL